MLTERAAQKDVVVSASTYGAARQLARGELSRTLGTATSQLKEGPTLTDVPVDSENGPGHRFHMHHMVALAAVLVGISKGPPAGSERKPAISTGEVS